MIAVGTRIWLDAEQLLWTPKGWDARLDPVRAAKIYPKGAPILG